MRAAPSSLGYPSGRALLRCAPACLSPQGLPGPPPHRTLPPQAECCSKAFVNFGYASCSPVTRTAAINGAVVESAPMPSYSSSDPSAKCYKRANAVPYQLCDATNCNVNAGTALHSRRTPLGHWPAPAVPGATPRGP
jgi:hypothetical protein